MSRITDLKDRVAIITGAGGGIGRATALVFAREGAKLVVADLPETGGEETADAVRQQGGEVMFIATDVSSRAAVKNLVASTVAEYGRLDCAFNNAGITGPLHSLVGYPESDFEQVVNVNLRGTWYCLQEEIPAMLETGGGAIVNTSSSLGETGAAGTPIYTATKHAVLGLTKAAALDTATLGVRINAVLPGAIDTAMPEKLMENVPGGKDAFLPSMPIGRLGKPSEIAEAVAWLCSDRASLATGAGFAIDGGYLAV